MYGKELVFDEELEDDEDEEDTAFNCMRDALVKHLWDNKDVYTLWGP